MISKADSYLLQIKDMSLVDLVQSQNVSVIEQLINIYDKEGTTLDKINYTNSEGFTPLHNACARGIPEIVELLLINGANINSKNAGGETPSHMAARRGSPLILSILKNYKAELGNQDNKGQSIVHNAVMNDSVLTLLWIETSTDISLKTGDSSGVTPLHLACIIGKINSIKFLLRKSRSDPTDKTLTRDNCLHLIIKHHQFHCMPVILFHNQKCQSNSSRELNWNEEKSLILLGKNSQNKTPLDLYAELPDKIRNAHHLLTAFVSFLRMSTIKQMRYNLVVYRWMLFSFPFISFLIGVVLSVRVWPAYRTVIMPVVAALSTGAVCTQGHRVNEFDHRQNPIFAGAFVAGVLHDLLCFYVNSYHVVRHSWEIAAIAIMIPLFVVCYMRIILVNPGKLHPTEIATTDFSQFLVNELVANKHRYSTGNGPSRWPLPLDKFCTVCEAAPNIGRVKHCKLCDTCVVNMDHHCLFLMQCIARNNMRNFILFIMANIALIGLFIEVSIKTIMVGCGPIHGASPGPYLYCSYTRYTWISVAIMINTPSLLWGLVMLRSQLHTIGYNASYYYYYHHPDPAMRQPIKKPLYARLYRIIYFLCRGRYYVTAGERHTLAHM